jgi:hypothetical protein
MSENRPELGMSTRRTLIVAAALAFIAAAGCETGGAFTDAGIGGDSDAAEVASCGNTVCEAGEACESCPEDCPPRL